MSKGSQRIVIRLGAETIAQIEEAIRSANERRREEPYDLSSWVRAAIAAKFAHLARSRRRKPAAPSAPAIAHAGPGHSEVPSLPPV